MIFISIYMFLKLISKKLLEVKSVGTYENFWNSKILMAYVQSVDSKFGFQKRGHAGTSWNNTSCVTQLWVDSLHYPLLQSGLLIHGSKCQIRSFEQARTRAVPSIPDSEIVEFCHCIKMDLAAPIWYRLYQWKKPKKSIVEVNWNSIILRIMFASGLVFTKLV